MEKAILYLISECEFSLEEHKLLRNLEKRLKKSGISRFESDWEIVGVRFGIVSIWDSFKVMRFTEDKVITACRVTGKWEVEVLVSSGSFTFTD